MDRENKQRICIKKISPKQKYIQRFLIAAIKETQIKQPSAYCSPVLTCRVALWLEFALANRSHFSPSLRAKLAIEYHKPIVCAWSKWPATRPTTFYKTIVNCVKSTPHPIDSPSSSYSQPSLLLPSPQKIICMHECMNILTLELPGGMIPWDTF